MPTSSDGVELTPNRNACYCGCGTTDYLERRTVLIEAGTDSYNDTRLTTRSCLRERHHSCARCGVYGMNEAMRNAGPGSRTWFCPICYAYEHPSCFECGSNHPRQQMSNAVHVPNGARRNTTQMVCENCRILCNQGGHYVTEDNWNNGNDDEDEGPEMCGVCWTAYERNQYRIRGYGHTHPTKWFGGPLPREAGKMQGFYLGFELEISTERRDAREIIEWERAHGMTGFFDCKSDSSVAGFEIATQPFTPEYFETMVADGRLASFFEMLDRAYPSSHGTHNGVGNEPTGHGLHVHIGRIAFQGDDLSLAAYSYLLGQDNGTHLERIGRRAATHYCTRVQRPASTALVWRKQEDGHGRGTRDRWNEETQSYEVVPAYSNQFGRLVSAGVQATRSAINLTNSKTVEIRAFKSTRNPDELAAAIRLVYVGARYVRELRLSKKRQGLSPTALHWSEFCKWVGVEYPDAFAALSSMGSVTSDKIRRQSPKDSTQQVDDGVYSIGEADFTAVRAVLEEMTPVQRERLERRRRKALLRAGIDPDVPRDVAPPEQIPVSRLFFGDSTVQSGRVTLTTTTRRHRDEQMERLRRSLLQGQVTREDARRSMGIQWFEGDDSDGGMSADMEF